MPVYEEMFKIIWKNCAIAVLLHFARF